MWQTCAMLIALATAGAPAVPPAPLPGEPARAFQCRATHQPEARTCTERCQRAFEGPGQAEAGWDCVLACSRRSLHAIADCRRAPAAPAAPARDPASVARTPLASR